MFIVSFFEIPNIIITLILVSFLAFSSYTDVKEFKIYNKSVMVFFIIRVLLIIRYPLGMSNLLGALLGGLIFFIPAFVFYKKMGGDIKAYTLIGFYLGVKPLIGHLLITLIVSFIIFGFFKLKNPDKKAKEIKIPLALMFFIAFVIEIVVYYTI